jgi:L-ascorbate metabolism protein UlaG (beta-lactamase superfamily)
MKNFILSIMLTGAAYTLLAQRPQPDVIQTSKGPLTIQPVQHASLVLTWNGTTIYFDPNGDAKLFEGLKAPDLIFITDIHGDHMNTSTLENLETSNAKLVVPQAVAEKLSEKFKDKLIILDNGKTTSVSDITISAIPMYNLPESADARHTKGRGNGYILSLGGKQLYVSGDTEDIPEMRALKNIDIAFICMNQPFTMEVSQAADAVLAFKPKIVYPYHYRGQGGLSDVEAFKKTVNEGNQNIEVRLKNWYWN